MSAGCLTLADALATAHRCGPGDFADTTRQRQATRLRELVARSGLPVDRAIEDLAEDFDDHDARCWSVDSALDLFTPPRKRTHCLKR